MGYSADQVSGITVEELRWALEDLNDDDEIITYDQNNGYGASYGKLSVSIDECEVEENA